MQVWIGVLDAGNTRVVATLHTHPNPGPDFQQEPGLTDIRGVRDDPDRGGPEYEGEDVVASELGYLIRKDGRVVVVGQTATLLNVP